MTTCRRRRRARGPGGAWWATTARRSIPGALAGCALVVLWGLALAGCARAGEGSRARGPVLYVANSRDGTLTRIDTAGTGDAGGGARR